MGREIERIRVVGSELSTYEKMEYSCYHQNVEAGERVLIMPRKIYLDLTPESLRGDFWILDDMTVWKNIYDTDGIFLGQDAITESTLVKEFVELYDKLNKATIGDYTVITKQINLAKVIIDI